MTLEEYNQQVSKLKAQGLEQAKAGQLEEAEATKTKIADLTAQFDKEKEQAAQQAAQEPKIVPDHLRSESTIGGEDKMNKQFNAASVEYKNAYLKHLVGRDDEMTELENAAFVQTTANTPNVIPTEMLNEIWDLVSGQHPIVGDVNKIVSGTTIEIPVHTAIAAGKGKIVAEGAANDDIQNTISKLTLSGKDFVADIDLSYATAQMSIDALQNYLVTEIANTIGEAMADHIVSVITSGINTNNKKTSAATTKFTYAEIAGAFAELKRTTSLAAYMTRKTLYTYVATLEDNAGHLIYVPNANSDASGLLLGANVKIEDSVADGTIIVGDPKRVPMNVIQDIMIESARDIKKHVVTYAGYARAEAGIADDKAFASLSLKTA